MSRVRVCITVLFLVGCTPGTGVIYGSSIRPGGGLPSITATAMGRGRGAASARGACFAGERGADRSVIT